MKDKIQVSQAQVQQPEKKAKKIDFKYILLAIFLVALLVFRVDNIYAWIAFVVFAAFVGNDNTQSDEDWRDDIPKYYLPYETIGEIPYEFIF